MKIGCHVSIAGGIFNAPGNAAKIGGETFQVFTRSPQGGPAPKLTDEVVSQFKTAMAKNKFTDFIIHTPYYINFASTTPRIRYGSISVVRDELERGSLLGASYVVTHLGSTKDAGPTVGFHKTWRSIQRILDGYDGSCELLLENSAGAGDLVGDTFEELAAIIKEVENDHQYANQLGVCLDFCHAFATGYDLHDRATVDATLKQFDQTIGFARLKTIHANDSKFALGEHKDRHEHIGRGGIGLSGFKLLIKHPVLNKVNWYLETEPGGVAKDIKLLKSLR